MIYHVQPLDPKHPGDTVRVEVSIREDDHGHEYLSVLALDGCFLEVGDDEPSTMSPPIYAQQTGESITAQA